MARTTIVDWWILVFADFFNVLKKLMTEFVTESVDNSVIFGYSEVRKPYFARGFQQARFVWDVEA